MKTRKNKTDFPDKEIRFHTAPGIEIRADDTPEGSIGTIGGYAAVYDSETDLGWFREVIKPGAFTRSIKEDHDVRGLWNHETGIILGRRSAGTLRLGEDKTGLTFEIDLPDTQAGRDALTSIKRGDITGMSFGFRIVKQMWVEEKEADTELREIHDVDLFEVSPVTFPAYADTTVGQRSLEKFQAERSGNQITRRMKARRLRLRHQEMTRRTK